MANSLLSSNPLWRRRLRPRSAMLMLAGLLVLEVFPASSAQAQTFSVLYDFTGQPDGFYPFGRVLRDSAGSLYGTTQGGGVADAGIIFKLNRSGMETVLASFEDANGNQPFAGVIQDQQGNFYGTTSQGGDNYGNVFKLDTKGNLISLYTFTGTNDGAIPMGSVIRDKKGNIYGTTYQGGNLSCNQSPVGCGVVFKLDKTGKETVLHSFSGSDGEFPEFGSLIMDSNANLYGTTRGSTADNTYGNVFKIDAGGNFSVLYTFKGSAGRDGCVLWGKLARDGNGNLYGTAAECGANRGGSVWKVSPTGVETVLYNFTLRAPEGAGPVGGVVRDSKGNLYGTTVSGGANNYGTIFKLDVSGVLTSLYSFPTGSSLGASPSGVTRDSQGNLYGTQSYGGSSNYGYVWELTP